MIISDLDYRQSLTQATISGGVTSAKDTTNSTQLLAPDGSPIAVGNSSAGGSATGSIRANVTIFADYTETYASNRGVVSASGSSVAATATSQP